MGPSKLNCQEIDLHSTDRDQWVKEMRKQFCRRAEFPDTKEMIFEDGTLNQNYFKPKIEDLRTWGKKQRKKLLALVKEHGPCDISTIALSFQPLWRIEEIEVKLMRLFGCSNLSLYVNFRGDEQAVLAEREKNLKLGESAGQLQQGIFWNNSSSNCCNETPAFKISEITEAASSPSAKRQRT